MLQGLSKSDCGCNVKLSLCFKKEYMAIGQRNVVFYQSYFRPGTPLTEVLILM